MKNRAKNLEPLGCFGKTIMYFFGIVYVAIMFGSIYILAPITERAVQENFCKPGTIRNESWGRRRTTTCIDKKTGRKTDVSIMQIIGCCPSGFISIFGLIFLLILGRILRGKKNPDDDFRRSDGNFRT